MKQAISGLFIAAMVVGSLSVIGMSANDAPPATAETAADVSNDPAIDIWEEQYLGHGARADWAASGFDVLDSRGESDVGTIVITGAEDRDIDVKVKIRSVIGPLNRSLPEMAVHVPQNEFIDIPIDMRFALDMHEKQAEYATRVHAEFLVISETEGERKYFQSLDPVYIAINEDTGELEVMDAETRDQVYPYGFTTREGQEMAEHFARLSESHGYIVDGIDPGIEERVEETEQQL